MFQEREFFKFGLYQKGKTLYINWLEILEQLYMQLAFNICSKFQVLLWLLHRNFNATQ